LESKQDIGICISGGGMRAASLTLGWLKALKDTGLLYNKTKYLTCNSGATWILVPGLYSLIFEDLIAAFQALKNGDWRMIFALLQTPLGKTNLYKDWAASVKETFFNFILANDSKLF
jgi:hypothetical protein